MNDCNCGSGSMLNRAQVIDACNLELEKIYQIRVELWLELKTKYIKRKRFFCDGWFKFDRRFPTSNDVEIFFRKLGRGYSMDYRRMCMFGSREMDRLKKVINICEASDEDKVFITSHDFRYFKSCYNRVE